MFQSRDSSQAGAQTDKKKKPHHLKAEGLNLLQVFQNCDGSPNFFLIVFYEFFFFFSCTHPLNLSDQVIFREVTF